MDRRAVRRTGRRAGGIRMSPTGAANDLDRSTGMAKRMVTDYTAHQADWPPSRRADRRFTYNIVVTCPRLRRAGYSGLGPV